jgi:hypothetical protein
MAEGELFDYPRAEPLAPEPFVSDRISVLAHPESIRPSFESLRQRFWRNFTHAGVPKSEHLEALNLELVLTPEEAARGILLGVDVPVVHPCPACGGTGRDWLVPCLQCGQEGLIEGEGTVTIRVPPLVSSGTTVEVPLGRLGIHNTCLRLHVSVGG